MAQEAQHRSHQQISRGEPVFEVIAAAETSPSPAHRLAATLKKKPTPFLRHRLALWGRVCRGFLPLPLAAATSPIVLELAATVSVEVFCTRIWERLSASIL